VKRRGFILPQSTKSAWLPGGTKVNFLLAFARGSCHKRSTVRLEAHRPQVQEGHSIGSFGVWKAQPQFWNDLELPQRDDFRRVGGSRRFWIEVNRSLRILKTTHKRGTAGNDFPQCAHKKKEKVMKEQGVVKWFNGAKGYGFIQRSSGEDVFVHFSAIQENGYKTLNEGDSVEFECQQGPKGLSAANVSRVIG
jgi:CspA family cold shock protein